MSSECLNAFTGSDARCVKCGNRGATTTYENENMPHIPIVAGAEPSPFEWLLRECMRCGYSWREAVVPPGQVTGEFRRFKD